MGASSAFAAGGSTHFHIADISPKHIDQENYGALHDLVKSYPMIYRVSSYFPDWGYAFPATNEYGEEAHWPPFQHAAIDHLVENYPEPWDEYAEKLFTFICGITGHGEADDVWHFGDTAFLNVANENDQVSGGLRDDVEIGCDIFVQAEKRWWYREPSAWWIPVGDLAQVYWNLGYSELTTREIERGVTMLHTAIFMEDHFGWLIYLPMKLQLPWTNANYMDWYDGGVRDDAVETARRLQELWDYKEGNDPASRFTAPEGNAHPRDALAALAAQMIHDGIVVPRVETQGSAFIIREPWVVDRAELFRRLQDFALRRDH